MFKLLKRLLLSSSTDSPVSNEVTVCDRLRRVCARDVVDYQHNHPNTLLLAPLPALPSDDANRTASADRDTAQSLEVTDLGAAEESHGAVAVPSLLQRIGQWLKGPAVLLDERRLSPRYAFGEVHREMRVVVGLAKWPATVADISATGANLILGIQHRIGTSLQLTILNKATGVTWPIQARVMRLALLQDGHWVTSCAFDRPLDKKALNTLR